MASTCRWLPVTVQLGLLGTSKHKLVMGYIASISLYCCGDDPRINGSACAPEVWSRETLGMFNLLRPIAMLISRNSKNQVITGHPLGEDRRTSGSPFATCPLHNSLLATQIRSKPSNPSRCFWTQNLHNLLSLLQSEWHRRRVCRTRKMQELGFESQYSQALRFLPSSHLFARTSPKKSSSSSNRRKKK